MTELE